jgi:teichuronic acid biosynthesis glycosyltransferase TuaC
MRVLAITNLHPTPESPGGGAFIAQQIESLRARGIELEVMFLNRRRDGPWIYYRLASALRPKVSEFAPDLIHVMYGGVMAAEVTRQRGMPPTIVNFHGSDLLGENLSGLWRKIISHYGVYCSMKAARRAHGVIVVARNLLNALDRRVRARKVRVIPCGIDLELFKPLDRPSCQDKLGWSKSHFHVLFVSSSGDPVKRPQLARAATEWLEQKRGPVQFHMLSGVPNRGVPVWLNASDVLLVTSKHEGSPTVVKEALACGLPIVSVAVGDIAERVANINGCYLAEASAYDLGEKLDLVYQRRERLQCRDKLEKLSCGAVAATIEEFYLEVLRRTDRTSKPQVPQLGSQTAAFGRLCRPAILQNHTTE